MNLRTFATVGAVAMLVLGGCVVVGSDGDGGAAGTAGSGGDGNTGNTGGAGGGTAGAGGGTAGAGGSATCDKTCAEAITNGNPVCADSTASLALYDALAACSCERGAADTPAGCNDDCGDNLCVNKDTSQACSDCVQKAACSADFNNCANDL